MSMQSKQVNNGDITSDNAEIEAQLGIFDYIETCYNKEHIHSKLDGLSPNEFEQVNQSKFITLTSNMQNYIEGCKLNV